MKTPRVKLIPPRLPASFVGRPELERALEEAERRRLTSIVAGAGFGKSTLAASLAPERGWAWYLVDAGDRSVVSFARGLADALELPVEEDAYGGGEGKARADDLAALLSRVFEDATEDDRVLVIDDVHELGRRSAGALLLERFVRQAPPELHLVLCSREEPPFPIDRLRGQGQVLELDASMLAFSGDEVAGVVERELGGELSRSIHDLTSGWPAAVQLATEMLQSLDEAERAEALSDVKRSGGRLGSYLTQEVLLREPEDVRHLLRMAAEFDIFSAELCQAVGAPSPADTLTALERRGLVAMRAGRGGWLTMHAVLRDFVRDSIELNRGQLHDLHLLAANWFASQGLLREALASIRAADDPRELARFFHERWDALIDRGFADAVVESATLLPEELLDDDLIHLIGRCHALLGQTGEALEWFESLPPGPFRAFQLADVYMQRGESKRGFDELLGSLPDVEDGFEMTNAFLAFVAPSLGELDIGEQAAERAVNAAKKSGNIGHNADAHAAVADIAQARGNPDRAERYYRAARELADRSGNVLAQTAARAKTARFWTTQGRYDDALELIESAIETADRINFVLMRSEGRHQRAWIWARRGRLDEAAAELAEGASLNQLAGVGVTWDHVAHGDHYRQRGDVARARVAYEEAIRQAHPASVRLRSIALGGIARMVALDDPDRAAALAAEAVEISVNERADILTTAAWVAIRRGELDRASELAAEALAEAARRKARPVLAEALEARAFCSSEPDRAMLEEALALWRELGEPVGTLRVELALARLAGAKLEADRLERELRALGFRDTAGHAAGVLMAAGSATQAPLVVETLGGFRVVRDGVPVPAEAWKSKKARDLLKILAARRGRPVARDELIEALWPEEDPSRTSNRLSVALSTLRSVLDPERAFPQDHFVAGADGFLRLSLETVELDVESFLSTAQGALRSWRAGDREQALPLLELAEAVYSGDFLEEDRYEDWAIALRDEARADYIDVLRALAEATQAAKYYLRILDRDPYDEPAHLALVSVLQESGSHGEARRAYRAYLSRMEEIGAEPAPFPAPRALSRV